ncbi:MAG: hypothetical protein HQ539_01960 [Parcubacteria group bacterium]|nr:hypothetical protein [Parcubacteria group bacterium]
MMTVFSMIFAGNLKEIEMKQKRTCQKCGETITKYTYALSNNEYDGQQRKVLLVCISCKIDIGIFLQKNKKG